MNCGNCFWFDKGLCVNHITHTREENCCDEWEEDSDNDTSLWIDPDGV